MNVLADIVAAKRKELLALKEKTSLADLEKSERFGKPVPSFLRALSAPGPSLIAEFKRKSPSKGFIKQDAKVAEIIPEYEKAGASAISILTDRYFDGFSKDLAEAADFSSIPLLRKDFIIDEFQVLEARSLGASAILLIAAVLEKAEIKQLATLAGSLGLDVLLEIHDEMELLKVPEEISIIGINNRNLGTFVVDLEHSLRMLEKLPSNCLRISESGLDSPDAVVKLHRAGFDGFLMGEYFMKQADPGAALKNFLSELLRIHTGPNDKNSAT